VPEAFSCRTRARDRERRGGRLVHGSRVRHRELAGLRGEGGFRANLGENAEAHLKYWFD
jgi:hypothetical protein